MFIKYLGVMHAIPFPHLPFHKVRQHLKNYFFHQETDLFLSKCLTYFNEYRAATSSSLCNI